ncbi:MAG: hypothetical protein ACK55Z_33405, partial [bacterium]
SEVIPAEEEDDDEYIEKGASKDPTVSVEVLEEEENRDAQCIQRSVRELGEQMEVHRRRAENRRRSEAWRSRPRETVSRKLASARAGSHALVRYPRPCVPGRLAASCT